MKHLMKKVPLVLFLILCSCLLTCCCSAQGIKVSADVYEANGFLYGVKPNTTVSALSKSYNGSISVRNRSGVIQGTAKSVGTGYTVTNGSDVTTAIVMGDLDGDGKISSNDALQLRAILLKSAIASRYPVGSAGYLAADVNNNGKIDSADFLRCRMVVLGMLSDLSQPYGTKSETPDGMPDVFDIVLFWGQSNSVGYSTPNGTMPDNLNGEDINAVYRFSEETDIDMDILQNTTSEGMTSSQIPENVGFLFKYAEDDMEMLTPNTSKIGSAALATDGLAGLCYNPSTGKLTKFVGGSSSYISLEASDTVNMIPEFCRTYYEATGHGVIAVNAGVGGACIQEFLPTEDESHAAYDGRQYLYEALKVNYQTALGAAEHWATLNHVTLGDSFWVSVQGESNVFDDTSAQSDQTYKVAYEQLFNKVVSNLRNDLGITRGAIVETSFDMNNIYCDIGVRQINASQEKVIAASDGNIICGSRYPYTHYVPNEDVYNNENADYNAIFGDYSSINAYKAADGGDLAYANALLRAFKVTCNNNGNAIHFHSAALAQIGREVALNMANAFFSHDLPKASVYQTVSAGQDNGAYFTNADIPINTTDVGDPCIVQVTENGKAVYYMFSTNNHAYRSEDLKNWTSLGSYVNTPAGFQYLWAPEVYFINNTPYLFVTFVSWGSGYPFCSDSRGTVYYGKIDSLLSLTTGGKFTLIGEVDSGVETLGLRSNVGSADEWQNNNHIDGHLFRDDDGAYYFYYKAEEGQEIYGVALLLNNDGTFSRVTDPVRLFSREDGEGINEGPFMIKENGVYYMMFSCGSYTDFTYRVRYATSTEGPLSGFSKVRRPDGSPVELVLGDMPDVVELADGNLAYYYDSDKYSYGTGHHFMMTTEQGEVYIVYHSALFTSGRETISWNNEHVVHMNRFRCRTANMVKLGFTDDGEIYINGPTMQLQPLVSGTTYQGVTYTTLDAADYTVTANNDAAALTDGVIGVTHNLAAKAVITDHLLYRFNTTKTLSDLWLYAAHGNLTAKLRIVINGKYAMTVSVNDASAAKIQLPTDIGTVKKIEVFFDRVVQLSETQVVTAE